MKILIFFLVFMFFLIIALLIGPMLDYHDMKKKQIKILKNKGFVFDKIYLGRKFTKFDIYIDIKKKKIFLYNKKFSVYDFNDLKLNEVGKDVNEGKIKYFVNFNLGDNVYNVLLKGKIDEVKKIKYEELVQLLDYIDKVNNDYYKRKKVNVKRNKAKDAPKKSDSDKRKPKVTKKVASRTNDNKSKKTSMKKTRNNQKKYNTNNTKKNSGSKNKNKE